MGIKQNQIENLICRAKQYEKLVLSSQDRDEFHYHMDEVAEGLQYLDEGGNTVVYTDGKYCLKLSMQGIEDCIQECQYNQPTIEEIEKALKYGVMPEHPTLKTVEQIALCLGLIFRTEQGYASVQPLANCEESDIRDSHEYFQHTYAWYDNMDFNTGYYNGEPVIIDWE